MDLSDTRRAWEELGRQDPLWAIATIPAMKGNRWDVQAFFDTGARQIAELYQRLDQLGIDVGNERCLDFGCGVGRVTQALCDYFSHCDGVDIAEPMIAQAVSWNRHPDRCSYHLNTAEDLSLFPSSTFDLVYTVAVLQHMPPRYAESYIREFVRVLKPGGIAVFDVPGSFTPVGPLADGAHRASICPSDVPATMTVGQRATLQVQVTNTSQVEWPLIGMHLIHLGNHWRLPTGEIELWDDGRVGMRGTLAPGASDDFVLEITAPTRPGNYQLELDMVEESVTWFAEKGSPTWTAPVSVRPMPILARVKRRLAGGRSKGDTNPSPPEPVMEMHVIPRDRVLEVIGSAGGRVLHVDEYEAHGSGYHTYQYFVAAG